MGAELEAANAKQGKASIVVFSHKAFLYNGFQLEKRRESLNSSGAASWHIWRLVDHFEKSAAPLFLEKLSSLN
jgi:hypothetical protein